MECCSSFSSTFVPTHHAIRSRPSSSSSVLRSRLLYLSRWKQSKRLAVVKSCSSDDRNSSNGNGTRPALSKVFTEEAIGAEYGEGFETFRMDGPLKMDVDFLNNTLQECFLQRIRHAMKPDEAFGVIFSWDNVVADTCSVKLDCWKQLAAEEGREMPSERHVKKTMLHLSADHVLQKILVWGREVDELERLKSRLLQLYHDNLLKHRKPMEGLEEWLDALYTAGIPCAVASCLDRRNMLESLERMGLKKYFQAVVTEEDGMESMAHRFLSAAVKLDRKPSKCIVFEDDPRGITAAHNCTMMAVALIGTHPAYELVQADLTVGSFNELSVINLRRLFAHKGLRFMDVEKQSIEKAPRRRKLTRTLDSSFS